MKWLQALAWFNVWVLGIFGFGTIAVVAGGAWVTIACIWLGFWVLVAIVNEL